MTDLIQWDFQLSNHGSVWLLTPMNSAAKLHLEENVSEESTWWGSETLVVEHRYVQPLVDALRAEGFTVSPEA